MRRAAALPTVVIALAVVLPVVGLATGPASSDPLATAFAANRAPAPAALERLTVGRDISGEREAGSGRHRGDPVPGARTRNSTPRQPTVRGEAVPRSVRIRPAQPEPRRSFSPRSPPESA